VHEHDSVTTTTIHTAMRPLHVPLARAHCHNFTEITERMIDPRD